MKFRYTKTKRILPLIIALSMLGSACSNTSSAEETDDVMEEPAVAVEVSEVKKTEINREMVYTGQVKPIEQVSVVPKAGGKVVTVNYDVGDSVRKNDPLFVLDTSDVQSTVNSAQAQYNAALAGVKSAEAGVTSAQAGVSSAQAGVDTAKVSYDMVAGSQSDSQILQLENGIISAKSAADTAKIAVENASLAVDNAKLQLENVETTFENSRLLYEAGAMAKADFEQVELGYNQAISGYEQAQLAYNQAKLGKEQADTGVQQAQEAYDLYVNKAKGDALKQAQSGVAQAQSGVTQAQSSVNQAQSSVNQAKANAEATKAQLDSAKKGLTDMTTTAPISGVISSKNVTVGEMASPSMTAFTIINIATVEIHTNVSEELINKISVGMKVPVYVRAVSDQAFEGVISSINPAADEANHTYPVKVTISNSTGKLKPGMFSEIRFTKEKSQGTIVLPRNTVMEEADSKYVFIEVNGVAKKQTVTTGIDNGEEIEILTGLEPGDCVITKGQTQVTDGEGVNVVDAQ